MELPKDTSDQQFVAATDIEAAEQGTTNDQLIDDVVVNTSRRSGFAKFTAAMGVAASALALTGGDVDSW